MTIAERTADRLPARTTVRAPGSILDRPQVRHVDHRPARAGTTAGWPQWLAEPLRASLAQAGIPRPWRHQVEAAEAAHAGHHVVLATATASGKSLGYLLPILAATGATPASPPGRPSPPDPHRPPPRRTRLGRAKRAHTALYLAPTKALAHDQLRAATALAPAGWRACTLDGDSAPAERDWARDHASVVLTNPDMLHRSVLPRHERWAELLGSLRYVVIDESHRYRGVFGAHVAAVVRRLRRLCAAYGADPVFVLASATSTNPAEAAARLIAVEEHELSVVVDDASPHGAVTTALWQPEEGSCDDDAAELLADLVERGQRTVAFVQSRKMAEVVALRANARTTCPVQAYRAGYLAQDRRRLERDLQSGALGGVAATNALELGVDIAGLDAVVVSGFPGTLAALRQQAGRAGRRGRDATVVLVARSNPLDAYLFEHPELIFRTPVERTVLFPDNPLVLGPQLCAAAQELPLTEADAQWFGPAMRPVLDRLAAQGLLRARPAGWFWTRPDRAVDVIDLRAMGRQVQVIEQPSGRVLGQVDQGAADGTVHEGAVYLHQGESYVVDELDDELAEARVHGGRPGWTTSPVTLSDVHIRRERDRRVLGAGTLHWGEVDVTSQVTGYLRRDEVTGAVWDSTPLELPQRRLGTQAVWWTLPAEVIGDDRWTAVRLGSAAHAAEHTAIGLLPLFAPCDRWDIGGLSTVLHPDTGTCTVFVHDGHPGGAGFARHGFTVAEAWLAATLQRLESCACADGCPACVVSPKCGNANSSLDKAAAIELMRLWVA